MSIRPLDMQVMVPKLQEVSRMQHLEQQKSGVMQQEVANNMKRNTEKNQKTVNKSKEDQKSSNDADAKKEGRNKYQKTKGTNNKKKIEKSSSNHRIDIKI